jgi:hypothetical protein
MFCLLQTSQRLDFDGYSQAFEPPARDWASALVEPRATQKPAFGFLARKMMMKEVSDGDFSLSIPLLSLELRSCRKVVLECHWEPDGKR